MFGRRAVVTSHLTDCFGVLSLTEGDVGFDKGAHGVNAVREIQASDEGRVANQVSQTVYAFHQSFYVLRRGGVRGAIRRVVWGRWCEEGGVSGVV